MSTPRRKLLINTSSVNLGCSCRRPRLSSIFNPSKKTKIPHHYQKHHNHHLSHSSSSSSSTTWGGKTGNHSYSYSSPYNATSSSSSYSSDPDGSSRVGSKSVAVEKESNDPYLDFRKSMVQMIVENEIYSKDGLKELLNCFLQLNDPSLHGVIIRVFTEIWNGFYFSGSRPSCSSSPWFYSRPKSYEI